MCNRNCKSNWRGQPSRLLATLSCLKACISELKSSSSQACWVKQFSGPSFCFSFSCQRSCAHHPFLHPCWARAHCTPGPSSTTVCVFPLSCQGCPGLQTYGWDPGNTIRAEATMLTISMACPRKGPPVLHSFGVLNPHRNCVHIAESARKSDNQPDAVGELLTVQFWCHHRPTS